MAKLRLAAIRAFKADTEHACIQAGLDMPRVLEFMLAARDSEGRA
jgi:hypothetical protein